MPGSLQGAEDYGNEDPLGVPTEWGSDRPLQAAPDEQEGGRPSTSLRGRPSRRREQGPRFGA